MEKKVTTADLERLESATATALAMLAGLLSEAVGNLPTAYHFAGALKGLEVAKSDPLVRRLLTPAYRLVLNKAQRVAPTDSQLLDLRATEFGSQPSH